MREKVFFIILLFLIVLIFWLRTNNTIVHISPTYDEALHLIQGYSYLKTNSTNIIRRDDQPVLAKIIGAFPLLFLKPSLGLFTSHTYWLNRQRYSFANIMLYYNTHNPEVIMNLGRRSIIVVSILFGIAMFFIISKKLNNLAGMLFVLLYFFNASILAHSCLVTQDLVGAIFYFLSIYTFCYFFKTKSVKCNILCGIFTGLLMVTKYTVVVLLFSFVVLCSYFWYIKEMKFKHILAFLLFQILGILVIGIIVYNYNISELFAGLFRVLSIVQEGRQTFFFGKYSNFGFKFYFPVLFLVKTEIPLLLLFFTSLILSSYKILKNKDFDEEFIFIAGIFIYIIVASFSKMQIGHRHLLPIYPMIFYLICLNFYNFKKFSFPYYLFVSWLVIISTKAHPWYLSYFNELIGGSKNAWKYFTDSNIDWGQGLKELGEWLKKNPEIKGIYLSYFGTADPNFYGIKYKPIGFVSNLQNEERVGHDIIKDGYDRVIIAVSVTNLQSTYYKDKTVFNFLKKLTPIFVAADSIFVYELTNKQKELKEFITLLRKIGYYEDINYISKKFLT